MLQFTALSGAVENDPTVFYFEYDVTTSATESGSRQAAPLPFAFVVFCRFLGFLMALVALAGALIYFAVNIVLMYRGRMREID